MCLLIGTANLQIVEAEPETLYLAWADKRHKVLDAVVWDYIVIEYEDDQPGEICKVEYWDREAVEKYIEDDGTLVPDTEAEAADRNTEEQDGFHMTRNGRGIGWGKVPFIASKGNPDELPLLNIVKSYMDAYDELASKSVDTLMDDIDAVLWLEGVSQDMGDLIRTRSMVQNSRIVTLDAGFLVHERLCQEGLCMSATAFITEPKKRAARTRAKKVT